MRRVRRLRATASRLEHKSDFGRLKLGEQVLEMEGRCEQMRHEAEETKAAVDLEISAPNDLHKARMGDTHLAPSDAFFL